MASSSDSAAKKQADPNDTTGEVPQVSMNLTSDEVNYLVFRYLQESGFVHSAFTFVYESMLGRTNLRNADRTIPPGALISFLQKGLQYVGIEESLYRENAKGRKNREVSASDEIDFSLLSPQVVAALTRTDPPIQLNVSPAAAAAAVKARLEAESKFQAEKADRDRALEREKLQKEKLEREKLERELEQTRIAERNMASVAAMSNRLASNASLSSTVVSSTIPQQNTLESLSHSISLSAHNALATQVAQQKGHATPSTKISQSVPKMTLPAESFGSDLNVNSQFAQGRGVHTRLPAVELVVKQNPASVMQTDRSEAERQHLANIAGTSAPTSNLMPVEGKRAVSERKSTKKGKSSEKQQQQQVNHLESQIASQYTKGPSAGFASLEEAVARLGTVGANNVIPKVVVNNGGSEAMDIDEENDYVSNPKSKLPAHSNLSSQTIPAQELTNGQRNDNKGSAAGHINNHLASASMQNGGQAKKQGATVTDQPHVGDSSQRKKQSGPEQPQLANADGPDSAIDREDRLTEASPEEILELRSHSSEVFMCAWNPRSTSLIATGSGDASARIWQMGGSAASGGLGPVRLLPHGEDPRDKKNKDVTTLEWSSDGKLLATGSYDGVARVWSKSGTLIHTLRGHKGPIFSLKWNRRGNYLLSGSYDKTTIVWDVSGSTGLIEQQFNDHQAPALDVDWKDDTTFASCSTDKMVHICKVGVPRPLKTYSGHDDEVNAVKWDSSGTLLASCSDDCTAKVWDVGSDRKGPLQDFKSHQQEIYTVKWSPTGPGSRNPMKPPILATASFDGSVRLWSVQTGSCIRVFSRHRDSVYSVAFSPSGDYLASGSLAGQLYIWNVDAGQPVKSYKGQGDIFEVAWNKEETRVAACFSSNYVAILDFRRGQGA